MGNGRLGEKPCHWEKDIVNLYKNYTIGIGEPLFLQCSLVGERDMVI